MDHRHGHYCTTTVRSVGLGAPLEQTLAPQQSRFVLPGETQTFSHESASKSSVELYFHFFLTKHIYASKFSACVLPQDEYLHGRVSNCHFSTKQKPAPGNETWCKRIPQRHRPHLHFRIKSRWDKINFHFHSHNGEHARRVKTSV